MRRQWRPRVSDRYLLALGAEASVGGVLLIGFGRVSHFFEQRFLTVLKTRQQNCRLSEIRQNQFYFQQGEKIEIRSLRLSPFGSVKLSVNSPFDDCESPFTFTFTFSGWVLDQQTPRE